MKETELKPDLFSLLLKTITNYHISANIERYDFADGFVIKFSRNGFYTAKIVRDWEIERCNDSMPYLFKKMVCELLKKEDETREAAIKIETSEIAIDLKGANNEQREAN